MTDDVTKGETYAGAGVSIDAGEEAVDRIKSHVRSTFRPEVIGDIGGFGGLFALDLARYKKPVLVSSTDGVGTKALVAQATGRFTTIGVDLVAMCVDDLVCQGAEPLFFLDYIAVGRLDPDHIDQLVEGVADGCRQAGCALVGGEMAEHPGAMEAGEFDLVGFAVGIADRDALITGATITPGDVLIGLPSQNLRSNGFSLARRVLLERAQLPLDGPAYKGAHHSLADELLAPSVIFSPAIAALQKAVDVRGVAHITGGGLVGNVPRMFPPGTRARIEAASWPRPPLFDWLQREGNVAEDEMHRVFNCGVGMAVVVAETEVAGVTAALEAAGETVFRIGHIAAGEKGCTVTGSIETWSAKADWTATHHG
jgi:phosphoribosylformylglycinamidine cyclo-ligase